MSFRRVWAPVVASFLFLSGVASKAQGPAPRLKAAISNGNRVALGGADAGLTPRGVDQGALSASTALKRITLVFNRSAAQQADLDTLLAAQQDTTSPLYHQWLTPDQFAARFGVADSDIATVETWLQAQGFQVTGVPRSRDRITFDGNAGQVAAAFGTELHRYAYGAETHFAPATNVTLPASLAAMVTGVTHLSDFHAHRQTRLQAASVRPAYTSSQTGNHFLTPSDLATMYDVSSLYKAGYNGTGQSIAILGQSAIQTAAITAFQTGAGLTANLPTQVLVPGTGVSAINPLGDGDEGESQLDVEYASGMAPGASVFFVYTGDSDDNGVFDSLAYAIAENIAPVISGSYGECEPDLQAEGTSGVSFASVINQEVQQATAQGQTVIFSSGDEGSTGCYGDTYVSSAVQAAPAVNFPASVPNVVAVGGTQMAAGTFSSTNSQYWQTATGTDVISSLLSYVPETTWNEDSSSSSSEPIASGGGGTSVLFQRPTWQAGVTGIPTGTMRLLPDISLQASIESPGFIYCTTDPSDLSAEGITASCSNGLRSPTGYFATAGGTSFSAPVFAGLVAVLNQAVHATGQGNINQTLYTLASSSTTYSSVFHDITSGTNACTAGSLYCSTAGAANFAATTGYDEATGLGSIDFAKLVTAWPASATAKALVMTTTKVTPASTTPATSATDQITITVAPQTTTGVVPTGTVQIAVDGKAITPALSLSSGSATYTYTAPTTTGGHVVTATYSGDATFAVSTGTAALTVGTSTATGSFTLAAQSASVLTNGTVNTAVTLTPASGYTGAVVLSLTYPSGSPTLCYAVTNPNTGGSNIPLVNASTGQSAAGAATLTIGEGTVCGTTTSGDVVLKGTGQTAQRGPAPVRPGKRWPEGVAFAGLLFAGMAFRRSRRLPVLLSVGLLSVLGLGLSGCGSGGSGTTTTTSTGSTPQTVTVTLTGTDSVNTSITSSTTFTLTIH